jgi:hypothetical protein
MKNGIILCVLLSGGLTAGGWVTTAQAENETVQNIQPALPRFSHPREITNPYLPLASLKQDILAGKEGSKKVRVERTARPDLHKTFTINDQSVEALAVEDREFENGQLAEVAVDYFAQADDGAVYYLGETVDEYKNGKVVGHSGAWMYGVDTKIPGVLMPAKPKVGDKFRSEDVPKITREDDEVVSVSETATVPAGAYRDCVKIKEVLSDGKIEYKYYAKGVGCVKEVPEEGELLLQSHTTKAKAQNTAAPADAPPQDELARWALSFVGADPDAEDYWVEAINDPILSAHERQDLIEDLNEDGLSDPDHPTMWDLPLIMSRLLLIEELAPFAMDQANADAFQEAYKDLANMYDRLTRL